jgi:hypothetical protein
VWGQHLRCDAYLEVMLGYLCSTPLAERLQMTMRNTPSIFPLWLRQGGLSYLQIGISGKVSGKEAGKPTLLLSFKSNELVSGVKGRAGKLRWAASILIATFNNRGLASMPSQAKNTP